MSDGFYPAGWEQPRVESKGEAQQRLANWICNVLRGWPFFMVIHQYEQDSFAKFLAAVVRRWPGVGKWKAPTK